MNALSWLLFWAFGAVCFAVGWVSGTWRREVADDRIEEARDAAWDAAYRPGTVVASPRLANRVEPPSGALTGGGGGDVCERQPVRAR